MGQVSVGRSRHRPGIPDLVFLLVLGMVLAGGFSQLLNDPGSAWHLRLGRDILRTGVVPRFDTLTFTRYGKPWVDQSWLFDVGLAIVVNRAGWPPAVAMAGLAMAWLYGSVARGLLGDVNRPIVALTVAMLAAGIGVIHFLVRPHLFTLGFVFLFLRICHRQHERGGWVVAWTPLLMIPWANLHGGFLAGPLIVFTAAAGHAVAGPLDADRRRDCLKFLGVGVACAAAALVNPYGTALYGHVADLLVGSGVTDLIQEYQPLAFGSQAGRVFELIILGFVALPAISRTRWSRYELAHVLVWMHLGFSSARHVPLFLLAASPALARLLDGTLSPEKARSSDEPAAPGGSWSLWPLAVSAGLLLSATAGWTPGDYDPSHWPIGALAAVDRLPHETPLFHEQDWGGLIEAECRPSRRAFIDDRFELFGRDRVLRYVAALEGGPDWDRLGGESGIRAVWVRPDRPLARRLDVEPGWCVRHRDGVSVLYEQLGPHEVSRALAGSTRINSGKE